MLKSGRAQKKNQCSRYKKETIIRKTGGSFFFFLLILSILRGFGGEGGEGEESLKKDFRRKGFKIYDVISIRRHFSFVFSASHIGKS